MLIIHPSIGASLHATSKPANPTSPDATPLSGGPAPHPTAAPGVVPTRRPPPLACVRMVTRISLYGPKNLAQNYRSH
jgi:hypothetical protein